jgi:hypothetical protein
MGWIARTYMYLKASMAGFLVSSREYFECTYWSRATSRTLVIAERWRIILAVVKRIVSLLIP